MKVPMKVLRYDELVGLSESSRKAGRNQYIKPDQLPEKSDRDFIVNFHFDHEWKGKKDVRLSVILEVGERTVWLDVSPEEYDEIREIQMGELEWEAAVCVGVPRWVP